MASTGNKKLVSNAGIPKLKDACIVLVKTEWNADIVDELENGCRKIFEAKGIKKIITILVPGAVEIPFAIQNYYKKAKVKPHAFIALGCVIKGGTPHFEYVCQSVTQGLTILNTSMPVPTIFGVLTLNNTKQAWERLGGKHGHKGEEAAITAIKMINPHPLTMPLAWRKG